GDWDSVSGSSGHALGIKKDGTLWSWGFDNSAGEQGNGTTLPNPLPTQVGIDSDWLAVAAGTHHSVAMKRDRSVWTWGSNSNGQLGIGTTTGALAPVLA